MRNSAKSLLIAPEPIAGESPASWVLRTSIEHGTSTKTLLRCMSIFRCKDPDLDLSIDSLRALARGTHVSDDGLQHLIEQFQYLRQDHAVKNLVHDCDDLPAYCFCPLCLQGDIEHQRAPHLRALWRFELWTICPEHRVRMRDACHRCDAPIHAYHQDADTRISSLLECFQCHGNYATDAMAIPVSLADRQRLDNQNLFVQLIAQARRISGPCFAGDHNFINRIARYLSFKSHSQRLYRREHKPAAIAINDINACTAEGPLHRDPANFSSESIDCGMPAAQITAIR
ncbi:MAG: TniQ family protein [Pseudomonadota bacterium]|nr:TniQ family protein [Pseudomonadota bacterium]